MLTLIAVVTWTNQGKEFPQFPPRGLRPSFMVPRGLITSVVYGVLENEAIRFGDTSKIRVELPYGEIYEKDIRPGYRFTLQVGATVVAEGTVLEITGIKHENRLNSQGILQRIDAND